MIVDFPVYFAVVGRKYGKRNFLRYGFVEHSREEIRDVYEREAPIAVTWRSPSMLGTPDILSRESTLGKSDPDGQQMTRWFEGRHWKRLLLGDIDGIDHRQRERLPPLDASTFERALEGGHAYAAVGLPADPDMARRAKPSHDGAIDEFEEVRKTTRDQVFLAIGKALERCIAVNGEIYRECLEPYLFMRYEDRPGMVIREMSVETDPRVVSPFRSRDLGVMFPLAEFDAASLMASRGTPVIRAANSEWLEFLRPEIRLAEAFSVDWKTHLKLGELLYAAYTHLPDDWPGKGDVASVLQEGGVEDRIELLDRMADEIPLMERLNQNTFALEAACNLMIDREISFPTIMSPFRRRKV